MTDQALKAQFDAVVQRLTTLQQHDRYEGCFVFGSYVTGEIHAQSDLDVVVLVADAASCPEVSHPRLQGIAVDISFNSFESIERYIHKTLSANLRRKPWLYDSQILFDKQGRLHELADWVRQNAKPTLHTADEDEELQLTCYYALTKAQKFVETEPEVALLVMQTDLNDLLRRHYKLQGRWWVSNKKLLRDLQCWDPIMHEHVRSFLTTATIAEKFTAWSHMIDHLLVPIGGRNFAKYEGVCSCERCKSDVEYIMELQ
ncbi:MAG: nucleotidyltransferase domain-containing protein [Caldilineaceae bacterium]